MATGPTGEDCSPHLTCEEVWRALGRASFAVVGHVNPAGEPRSSGIVYAVVDRHLYVAVDPTGWKARQIADGAVVSVTVPVRRGGILALLIPIPPATISFHARVVLHPAGSLDVAALPKQLRALLPDERRASACVLELVPEGRFATYGIGVSLQQMRDPVAARDLVPIG